MSEPSVATATEDLVDQTIDERPTGPSMPYLARILARQIATDRTILEDLTKLKRGVLDKRDRVAEALACAAIDRSYPPTEIDRQLIELKSRALEGRLDKAADLAADLVEQAIRVAHSARQGVLLMDALGEIAPPGWSNLPPCILAREINRLGHSLLRGRLPGWQES